VNINAKELDAFLNDKTWEKRTLELLKAIETTGIPDEGNKELSLS